MGTPEVGTHAAQERLAALEARVTVVEGGATGSPDAPLSAEMEKASQFISGAGYSLDRDTNVLIAPIEYQLLDDAGAPLGDASPGLAVPTPVGADTYFAYIRRDAFDLIYYDLAMDLTNPYANTPDPIPNIDQINGIVVAENNAVVVSAVSLVDEDFGRGPEPSLNYTTPSGTFLRPVRTILGIMVGPIVLI